MSHARRQLENKIHHLAPAEKGLGRVGGRIIAFGTACSLSPLAVRAFTPVFDGLWRGGGVRGRFRNLRLAPSSDSRRGPLTREAAVRRYIAMAIFPKCRLAFIISNASATCASGNVL